ncbi:MAG: NosD domain-containing protein, partial [Methanothrix sp.]|nr:NosD domain-containing protein [Methanothrix sp.]
ALAAAMIILSSPTLAATIAVSPGESIQAAIDEANSGDTIFVESGIYRESLNISKAINLLGSSKPVLDGGAMNSAVLLSAGGASISGFEIRTIRHTGIFVTSEGNLIENNTISDCLDGIRLDHSRSNNVSRNDVNNNTNGIALYSSSGNRIERNLVRDNYINEEGDCGIFLAYCQDNIIENNIMSNNGDASLSLRSSGKNTLRKNLITNNDWYGICLSDSSNGNVIEGNQVLQNGDSGIYLDSSRENTIRENLALDNSQGIYLAYDSNDNLLQDNNLTLNGKGLHLATHSSNNTVQNNTAIKNGFGIYLSFSSGWNLLFSNHLIDNGLNAYDLGQKNRWDHGTLGNYYSDLGKIFYVPGGPGVDRHPMAEPLP